MVKILIIYDSRSGNTEKMATAVAEGAKQIKATEVFIKLAKQALRIYKKLTGS